MESVSRRELFVRAGLGLTVGGVLRADAEPTERSGLPIDYERLLALPPAPSAPAPSERVLQLTGGVWGIDTRQPVVGAVIDVWPTTMQSAQAHGAEPGRRVRAVSDSAGRYELEVQRPASYREGRTLRPARLHLLVRHPRYATLVTQLAFAGDPYLVGDAWTPPSLVIPLERLTVGGRTLECGAFDLVLDRP